MTVTDKGTVRVAICCCNGLSRKTMGSRNTRVAGCKIFLGGYHLVYFLLQTARTQLCYALAYCR